MRAGNCMIDGIYESKYDEYHNCENCNRTTHSARFVKEAGLCEGCYLKRKEQDERMEGI
jgi:hypothetical protein